MRITVGHILLVGILGAGAYYASTKFKPPWRVEHAEDYFLKETRSLLGFFDQFFGNKIGKKEKTGEGSTPLPEQPIVPLTVVTPMPPSVVNQEPAHVPVAQNVTNSAPAVPQPNPSQAPENKSKFKAPVKKYPRMAKNLRKPVHKKVSPQGEIHLSNDGEAAANLEESGNAEKLIGSYVVLELTSGQKIQGVLIGKTSTTYQFQLPGLGTFSYAVDKVKSVTASK